MQQQHPIKAFSLLPLQFSPKLLLQQLSRKTATEIKYALHCCQHRFHGTADQLEGSLWLTKQQTKIVREPKSIRTSVITIGVCPSETNCYIALVTQKSRFLQTCPSLAKKSSRFQKFLISNPLPQRLYYEPLRANVRK